LRKEKQEEEKIRRSRRGEEVERWRRKDSSK
jgi:hypothetical protein